ncbi:MAG: hypothetical protein AB8C46_16180 [Burkholderiaceae bacterium]
MKKLIAIVALLSVFGSLGAATGTKPPEAQSAKPHSIVGKWQWTIEEKQCTETYEYRADGSLSVTSGDEVAEATYDISPQPDSNGFFLLNGTPGTSNGEQDCTDRPAGSKQPAFSVYVVFHPTEPLLLICENPNMDRCLGPMRRVND